MLRCVASRGRVGRVVLIGLAGVVLAGSLAGCYRKTVGAKGLYSDRGVRIEEPDAPPPDAPLFPWWSDDDDD